MFIKLEMELTQSYPAALPHTRITEIFDNVFSVTGLMEASLVNLSWKFSRNMTILRNDNALTLVNAIRLDQDGLDDLQALGDIKHVMRIGSLHDRDSRFYVEEFGAQY